MKRRGMSQVVTTVIIILVVLAAVVLIWGAIRNTVSQAANEIGSTGDCLTIDLDAVSCSYTGNIADVTIRRNAGDGALGGIKFVFNEGREVLDHDRAVSGELPDELETKTFVGFDLGSATPSDVSVTAVVGDNICDVPSNVVDCDVAA